MKKQFFSLVMMFALVIVAGTAMAQTGITPYPGGTYTYTLDGIKLNVDGTVNIEYTGGIAGTVISNFVNLTGTNPGLGIAASVTSISFNIVYDPAETAGSRTIKVTIFENGCSNFITKTVTIQNKPALTLSILASEANPICQLKETPVDNVAAAITSGNTTENTFNYTVKPVVTNVATNGLFDYSYTITLPTSSILGVFNVTNNITSSGAITGTGPTYTVTYSGVSAIHEDVFTVKFNTTTGKPDQTLTASLTTGTLADAKLTVTAGAGQYMGTITPSLLSTDDVVIKSMPSIGSFTWNP